MKLTKTLAGIAALLFVGGALNAASITQNATQNVTFPGVDFYFNKFDSTLGTLTGVSLTIYSVQNSGNFTVHASTAVAVNVTAWQNSLYFSDLNGGTGLPYSTALVAVGVSPSLTYTVPGNTTKLFTLTTTPVLANNNIVSITGDYSGYQSIGGSGNATFTANMYPSLSKTGGGYVEDYTNTTANTKLTLTYTYDAGPVPVPEASTVVAQLLIVAGGVWMFVRRRRAAAVLA